MFGRLHRLLLQVFGRLPRRVRRWIVRLVAPSFTVGAMCFIERDDGAVLLVRHTYRRRWGTPGGLLNRGERPEDAVRREVLEEVGVPVVVTGSPSVVVDSAARRVDIIYRARLAPGVDPTSVRPSSTEITACEWFLPAELPEVQFETGEALATLDPVIDRLSRPVRPRAAAREGRGA